MVGRSSAMKDDNLYDEATKVTAKDGEVILDGPDHVDAHRIPAFVISPFAPAGKVVHTRYDFLSVIRSIELILGMKPLGLFDQLATPMYDAFQSQPSNAAPYDAIASKIPRIPPASLYRRVCSSRRESR